VTRAASEKAGEIANDGGGGIVSSAGALLIPREDTRDHTREDARVSNFALQSCARLVEATLLLGVGVAAELAGGGGGIRTHGPREGTPVFKTGAFNRSATPPGDADCARKLLQSPRPVQPEGKWANSHGKTRFDARPGPSAIRCTLLPESAHSIQTYALRQSPGGLKQGPKPFAVCNSHYGKGDA
jgi:hypothetical protein